MSTAKGRLSIVVRSHGPVPSSGTWQRGSILSASCGDVFWACIARWQAPAIADPRALSQGSIWFSKGSRSLRTVSLSFQSSAFGGTGDTGGGGVAGAGYLNRASSRSVHWTVGVSGEPSKGVFRGGNFPSLIIEGEVIRWALLWGGHGCIIISSKEDGLVGDRQRREGHILVHT